MSLNLDWVKTTLEFFERHCAEVWFLTGIVLFVPPTWLAPIGIASLVSDYRPQIGVFFALTSLVLLARFFRWLSTTWKKEHEKRAMLKALQARLHSLTPEEKTILRYYVAKETRTQALDPTSGVVGGLEKERIIFKSSEFGQFNRWDYNMQPWAWTYLNEHRELVREDA